MNHRARTQLTQAPMEPHLDTPAERLRILADAVIAHRIPSVQWDELIYWEHRDLPQNPSAFLQAIATIGRMPVDPEGFAAELRGMADRMDREVQ